MRIEWHHDARTERAFLTWLLIEGIVESTLSILAVVLLGWPALLSLPVLAELVNRRAGDEGPLLVELIRHRTTSLQIGHPRLFRPWLTLFWLGAPVRLLRGCVVGFTPQSLFHPYAVEIHGTHVVIASEHAQLATKLAASFDALGDLDDPELPRAGQHPAGDMSSSEAHVEE